MLLGVLKDIKIGENRVVLTPSEIATIINDGHEVYVEDNAGYNAGFYNEEYISVGAKITDKETIFKKCDVVTKVKEIDKSEYGLLKEKQIIYACVHPASHKEEVDALIEKKVVSFAAEDTHRHGSPNCEAAGKAGVLLGLTAMMTMNGGNGKFVSGLGTAPGINALVLGCGIVGKAAIEVLQSLGAWVTVAATNVGHLREISSKYDGKINTIISNQYNIKKILPDVDMVVNCVRWDKSRKDYLITRDMVKSMAKGSVIVDISNDVGVIETFHETTLEDPIYIEEDIVHYCVCNIPSAIARSASIAYASAVGKHVRNIMNNGLVKACANDGYLRRGLVTYDGYLTHEETSQIQNRPWVQPEKILDLEMQKLDPAPKNTVAVSDLFYEEFK